MATQTSEAASQLTPLALAMVSLAIVVAIGGVVLAEMRPVAADQVLVDDESATPSTPFPTNYTVARQSQAGFLSIEDVDVVFNDTSAGTTTTLSEGTDFVVFNDAGNVEFQNTTSTTDYNSSEDEFLVSYTSNEEGAGTSVFDTAIDAMKTFSDFFTVIIIVGIAAVLFLLLRVVRGNGMA